jgi:hypothetical protein
MPNSDLLAVAFTDLNGNDKYNQGKDTLIAALVDTNNDGVVSVGDTIQWGTYPKIADGSESGTGGIYTSLDTLVTNVSVNTSIQVEVQTADGTVSWIANPNAELFRTADLSNIATESVLRDIINFPGIADEIHTNPLVPPGPGAPSTSIDFSTSQLGDQAFLDVIIFSQHWLV